MKVSLIVICIFLLGLIFNFVTPLPPLKDIKELINKPGCDKGMPIDPSIPIISHYDEEKYGPLPEFFDAREKWPSCIHSVRDQGTCGSCWAFATTEVISDRICIISQGQTNVVLSPQELLSCDPKNDKCHGGIAPNSFKYMTETGVSTEECNPYMAEELPCLHGCVNASIPHKIYKCLQIGRASCRERV